ncbi:MAG: tyrosine-type recombinase/integrase [Bacillota bacterium]|nr:tyrosine-type recombinase/integrase [Bacillota bacterium]
MQYNITYREKDGGWQYIISYKDSNGKWKQKSKQGFPLNRKGKQEAKDAALVALDEIKNNLELRTSNEFGGITFGEFSKAYLEHSKLYNELKTIQSTQTTLRKFSSLNDKELSTITTMDIQRIVDDMIKDGLNPNTVKYYLKKLTIIFNSAKNKYNIINTIPTHNIKIKSKEVEKRALTEEEIEKLLMIFKDRKYYLLIYIAVNTGMRLGEILGLTWKDIDFNRCIIKVNKQWKKLKDGKYNFGELKTKNSHRVIPISKSIADEIASHKNVIGMDNRVFDIVSKDNFIVALNTELKKNGFDITIHELRHTYATKLVANGLDFKTVANILGHTVQQTIKTYSHVNSDMFTKAQNLIEKIF